MRKLNFQAILQSGHTPIDRIKETILIKIILRIKPFLFQFSPKGFGNVQMWRIWGEKENVQSSFLPIRDAFPDGFALYTRALSNTRKVFLFI